MGGVGCRACGVEEWVGCEKRRSVAFECWNICFQLAGGRRASGPIMEETGRISSLRIHLIP